jgi:hypothetical protein
MMYIDFVSEILSVQFFNKRILVIFNYKHKKQTNDESVNIL